MRVNVLQHAVNEGPGVIAAWCHEHQHTMTVYHPAEFGRLPALEDTDMLIILGGPMSPNDDFDWLAAERDLIREAIARNIPVLGVCLGAQQIAKACGYLVSAAPVKEVGWAPVRRVSTLISGLPATAEVLHWHQDMFTVPDEAELLYQGERVANQAFVFKHHPVVGFQFHFEPLADNLREIVVNDAAYDKDSVLQQTPAEILAHGIPVENPQTMRIILDYLATWSK